MLSLPLLSFQIRNEAYLSRSYYATGPGHGLTPSLSIFNMRLVLSPHFIREETEAQWDEMSSPGLGPDLLPSSLVMLLIST